MATNGWLKPSVPFSVLRETEKAVLATLGMIDALPGQVAISTWLPKSAVEMNEQGQVVRVKARYLTNRYRNSLYGAEPGHDEDDEQRNLR